MNGNRRDFLKLAGAAGLAGLGPMTRGGAPDRAAHSHKWMGMLTDLTLCVGCRKCEWACRRANGLADDEPIEAYEDTSVLQHKRRTDARHLTVVNRFPANASGRGPTDVKRQCMHCNEPACASACLVAAFRKTPQGPVVYDESVCIGCRYCMIACPFTMPAYTYDEPFSPRVSKCSMCFERIESGGDAPACARICPKEAITFGKRDHLLKLAHEKINRRPGHYIDHVYGEFEAGGTSWLYIADRPFEELGFPAVGSTPYPELTRDFLSSVPLVLTIWPALLIGAYAFAKHRAETGGADSARAGSGEN